MYCVRLCLESGGYFGARVVELGGALVDATGGGDEFARLESVKRDIGADHVLHVRHLQDARAAVTREVTTLSKKKKKGWLSGVSLVFQ